MTPLTDDGRPVEVAYADEREAARDVGRLFIWATFEHVHAELALLERRSDRQSQRIAELRARLREQAVA